MRILRGHATYRRYATKNAYVLAVPASQVRTMSIQFCMQACKLSVLCP